MNLTLLIFYTVLALGGCSPFQTLRLLYGKKMVTDVANYGRN